MPLPLRQHIQRSPASRPYPRTALILICALIVAVIALYKAPTTAYTAETPLYRMRTWLQTIPARFNIATPQRVPQRFFASTQGLQSGGGREGEPDMSAQPPTSIPESMSTSISTAEGKSQAQTTRRLALPAGGTDGNGRTLDLSDPNSSISLDHLGPMVVNNDGTLSRISNWEQMSEVERKNTLRVLGKRNKERLERLKAAEGEVNGEEGGAEGRG